MPASYPPDHRLAFFADLEVRIAALRRRYARMFEELRETTARRLDDAVEQK